MISTKARYWPWAPLIPSRSRPLRVFFERDLSGLISLGGRVSSLRSNPARASVGCLTSLFFVRPGDGRVFLDFTLRATSVVFPDSCFESPPSTGWLTSRLTSQHFSGASAPERQRTSDFTADRHARPERTSSHRKASEDLKHDAYQELPQGSSLRQHSVGSVLPPRLTCFEGLRGSALRLEDTEAPLVLLSLCAFMVQTIVGVTFVGCRALSFSVETLL
jgi:hypothetical protein